MAETVPCPRCKRPNALHKVKCLYCGEAMPNPTAPPPPRVQRAVPEDLDALVRTALRTGRIQDLSSALHNAPAEAARPSTDDDEPPTDPGLAPTPEPEPIPPAEALAHLLDQVERLRAAEAAPEARDLLANAPQLLDALIAEVGDEAAAAERVPVVLPAFRKRWVMLASPWGADFDLGALSAASGLDQATLRMQGRHAYAQVIARSDDPDDLAARAARVRDLGLTTTVLERATLAAIDAPRVLLRRDEGGTWVATSQPLWQPEASFDPGAPPPGEALGALDVTLAVPADVVVQRYRQGSEGGRLTRKRDAGTREVGESRVGVLDLHGPGTFVRVVEGITDLSGLPGAVAGSSRASFAGVVEQLDQVFPGVAVAAKRICQSAQAAPTGKGPQGLARSGWPRFEEHTRLLRIAALGTPE